jgi:hypothetical protein
MATHTKSRTTAPKPRRRLNDSAKPLHPALTPERIAELRNLAKRIDREEKDEIIRDTNEVLDRFEEMLGIFGELKTERVAQGLSLADVANQVGGGRENLAKLEKGTNCTLITLFRYAEALGKRIEIKLVD